MPFFRHSMRAFMSLPWSRFLGLGDFRNARLDGVTTGPYRWRSKVAREGCGCQGEWCERRMPPKDGAGLRQAAAFAASSATNSFFDSLPTIVLGKSSRISTSRGISIFDT